MAPMDSVASRVEVTPSENGWSIVGEVDASTSPTVADALAIVPEGGRKSGRIVVETSGVSFIDSSGLRVLIELSERAAALGAKVVLASPSRSMARLIELTGLNDLFVVESTS
jgi:anti-sigma B factor antagonist